MAGQDREEWPGDSPLKSHPAFRAFAYPNYRLFFAGQLVSLVGTWMQTVAQAWLIYRLTGSEVRLGLVGFAGQIPVFLLSPLGGSLADRLDKRRVIVVAQIAALIQATVLAGLTLSGHVQIAHVFALAALLGVINAFDIPARQAFQAELVGKADLINAIALNSSMFNGARIIGPALAGILVAAVGEGWCFALNALSYLAVLVNLLRMKLPARGIRPRVGSGLAHLTEGFRFVATRAPVRILLGLIGMASLLGMPYAVLMPVFAGRILNGGAQDLANWLHIPNAGALRLGILMGASGIGALAAALLLASRSGVRGLGRWVRWSSVAFGLALVAFSASRSFWLSVLLLIPVGFAMMTQMAASNTLLQSMTPDALRGRVIAVYSMMFMGMAPVGSLLAGALAERLGAPRTIALGGVACVLVSIVLGLRLKTVRDEGRRLIVAQEAVGGDPAEERTNVAAT